jgi:ubiquinone/menaquinone biosynthesis C-methylase UbiE
VELLALPHGQTQEERRTTNMPEPIDTQRDNPSGYTVADQNSEAEMIRLMIQDGLLTSGVGGPLPEQPDPARLARVLDLGCGPGGWALEAAGLYPHMELVGVDISWRMIEFARGQAQARKLTERVAFSVADALRRLDFSDDEFDLVNLRLGSSFLRLQDWPRILAECLRVVRPGGIVRLTDNAAAWESTSPSFNRLVGMFMCALYRSGRHVSEHAGVGLEFLRWLEQSGCTGVQSKDDTLELTAGTVGGQNFQTNMQFALQTWKPFIQQTGCAEPDYDALCEQALLDMQLADFRVRWPLLTAWGTKSQQTAA